MTSSIRRPQAGDRVRKLADIHGTTIAWFTVTRVAFNPEGDYRDVLALEYGHDVDGNLCFHSATAALNDQRRDLHGHVVAFDAVEARLQTCRTAPLPIGGAVSPGEGNPRAPGRKSLSATEPLVW